MGMENNLQIYTNPKLLHNSSSPVMNDELSFVIENIFPKLVATLEKEGGVGLSAPQVGIYQNIFIMDDEYNQQYKLCINPKVIYSMPFYKSEKIEACLSVPNKKFLVSRPQIIRVEYTNQNQELITEDLKDYAARIYQHEIDHLLGILISDIGTLLP